MVEDLHETVRGANAELERIDNVLGAAESVTGTVDSASRPGVPDRAAHPVVKGLALATGANQAYRRFRGRPEALAMIRRLVWLRSASPSAWAWPCSAPSARCGTAASPAAGTRMATDLADALRAFGVDLRKAVAEGRDGHGQAGGRAARAGSQVRTGADTLTGRGWAPPVGWGGPWTPTSCARPSSASSRSAATPSCPRPA